MEKCQCSQCGSTDFNKEGEEFLRCAHCRSLFRLLQPQSELGPKLIIKKGANVVFGKNSNVVVKGGMQIDDGAKVQFFGKLEIIEKSSEEKIAQAKKNLELLRDK